MAANKPKRRRALAQPSQELKERASRINAQSRVSVPLSLRVRPETYKAIVELAEEFHAHINTIVNNALGDGLARYRDFSAYRHQDAIVQTGPLRAFPEIVDDLSQRSVQKTALQRGQRGVLLGHQIIDRVDQENPDLGLRADQHTESIIGALSAPLPQAPPPRQLDVNLEHETITQLPQEPAAQQAPDA